MTPVRLDELKIDIPGFFRRRSLRSGYAEAGSMAERWAYIRQAWTEHMPYVLGIPPDRWVDPYWVNWDFSPAERAAWDVIRCDGGTVLYPQVPVFNWFIDFGHPVLRIGLEVDGAAYHDKKKDTERDLLLWEQGWRIFRVPAREFTSPKYAGIGREYQDRLEAVCADGYSDDEEIERRVGDIAHEYMMSTGDGVIAAIGARYFKRHIDTPLRPYVLKTLSRHRYVEFEL